MAALAVGLMIIMVGVKVIGASARKSVAHVQPANSVKFESSGQEDDSKDVVTLQVPSLPPRG